MGRTIVTRQSAWSSTTTTTATTSKDLIIKFIYAPTLLSQRRYHTRGLTFLQEKGLRQIPQRAILLNESPSPIESIDSSEDKGEDGDADWVEESSLSSSGSVDTAPRTLTYASFNRDALTTPIASFEPDPLYNMDEFIEPFSGSSPTLCQGDPFDEYHLPAFNSNVIYDDSYWGAGFMV